jgi:cold-inducible RNA-binding protein
MGKKLFVGGLPYETTDATLKEVFSEAGTVDSVAIIMDRYSGRSKGFGFVEMSSEEEAQKAIETLNGKEIDGRNVTVNEARPMEDRPREGGFKPGFRGGDRRRGFGNRRNNNW